MDLVNRKRAVIATNVMYREGVFNEDHKKDLRDILDSFEDCDSYMLFLVETFNLSYLKILKYVGKKYEFLKNACVARPDTLKEIFFISFHDLAEVIKLFTKEELETIISNGNFTLEMIECFVSSYNSNIKVQEKKENQSKSL